MINFKCTNCGGEMAVSRIGDLKCPYCGSNKFFSDRELQEYKAFRLRMLEYLSAASDEEKCADYLERLWNDTATEVFTNKDGVDITIQYIYKSVENGVWMYAARRNVIYIYPKERKWQAEDSINFFSKLTYPKADVKNLERCFPVLAGRYELEDGRIMIVYSKDENMYPVSMFGSLPAKHVEWIISRLENIACVLAFNDMAHGGITAEAVFINPKTHEAALYGNWSRVKEYAEGSRQDLRDIRTTATALLGKDYGDAPKPLINFLTSEPISNAYNDFARWDEVIEKELGGRHFTKFTM